MIIDASIALKWRFREPDSLLAERLLSRHDLAAPSILSIEMRYVNTKLVRQRVLTASDAREPWLDALEAKVNLIDSQPLLDEAFELSLRLNTSFYDCVYLALAIDTGDVLVTADAHFIHAVQPDRDLRGRVLALVDAA